jgi:hypothetical protein
MPHDPPDFPLNGVFDFEADDEVSVSEMEPVPLILIPRPNPMTYLGIVFGIGSFARAIQRSMDRRVATNKPHRLTRFPHRFNRRALPALVILLPYWSVVLSVPAHIVWAWLVVKSVPWSR